MAEVVAKLGMVMMVLMLHDQLFVGHVLWRMLRRARAYLHRTWVDLLAKCIDI